MITPPGTYVTEELPREVAHAKRLEAKYAADKPIRRITVEDLGGIERHRVRASPFVPTVANQAKAEEIRRELSRKVVQHLRIHGPTKSSELSMLFDANALRIGMAVRGLVNVRSGVASGEREKTYWLISRNGD